MREEIESLTICSPSITSPEWEVCQRIQKIGSYNCILVPTFWLCPCTCPCIVSSFCCILYTKHGTVHQKLDHYCKHKVVSKCLYWANCCQLMLNCSLYRDLNSLCDVRDNQNSTSKLWWNLSRWLSKCVEFMFQNYVNLSSFHLFCCCKIWFCSLICDLIQRDYSAGKSSMYFFREKKFAMCLLNKDLDQFLLYRLISVLGKKNSI